MPGCPARLRRRDDQPALVVLDERGRRRGLGYGDLPRTRPAKPVEPPVHTIVHGQPVNNRTALASPEAPALFEAPPELPARRFPPPRRRAGHAPPSPA